MSNKQDKRIKGVEKCKKVFFTSDHHFGHGQIIDYENRPFQSVEEMNNYMIKQWNKVVGKNDLVFHVGDFSFLNKEETTKIFLQLKGRKRLILGNHDRARSKTWWKDVGFEEVYEYPIIYDGFFFVSHEPMYMNKHMPYICLHGHIHNQRYEDKQHFNVSVEHWDYEPIEFELLKQLIEQGEW